MSLLRPFGISSLFFRWQAHIGPPPGQDITDGSEDHHGQTDKEDEAGKSLGSYDLGPDEGEA